jgi:hypothetical protein
MSGLLGSVSFRMVRKGILGTRSLHWSTWRRLLKILLSLLLLPDTCFRLQARHRRAPALLARYPQIPSLVDGHTDE